MTITLQHYLVLAAALFAIGAAGAVLRRNILIIFISIEIMFGAACLAILAFSRWNLLPDGKAAVLFIMAVMAAEAAVGLSLVVALFRRRRTVFVDEMRLLRD
ncbi:MAG: NADH-quinone oxidoreductase subunit NuoK [Pseudomonadota bacterium]